MVLLPFDVFQKIEPIIKRVAYKFIGRIDGLEFEDLMQNGRLVAWRIIDSKKIDEATIDNYLGYINNSLIYSFNNDYKKSKAQKRIRLSETRSLDEQLNLDDSRSLYEMIPARGGEITFETLETVKEIAIRDRNPKAVKAVVYCLAELMDLNGESDVSTNIKYNTFVQNGLAYYLWIFFNNSPYMALSNAYPNIKPWDMAKVPNNFWSGKRGQKRAIKLLIKALKESNYQYSDYPILLTEKFIQRIGLATPYCKHFRSCPYLFLDAAFPGVYKPWELPVTPKGYFTDNNDRDKEAVRWLIEKRLAIEINGMSEFDIWRKKISKLITKETFECNGLRGLLMKYHNSPELLVKMTYPGKFMEWDFPGHRKWKGSAGLSLAARATKWVIEEYVGVEPTGSDIGYRFFVENGLHGMITSRTLGFNSSPKRALENAYPHHTF